MKNTLKALLLVSLIISNSFSMNGSFKAAFVKEGVQEKTIIGKTVEKQNTLEAISEESKPILEDIIASSDSLERILNNPKNCLKDDNGFENCPDNLIQCNQLVEKDKGLSTLHKDKIIVNKFKEGENYICPKDFYPLDNFNSERGQCQKDYSYYTYSCNSELNEYNLDWKGPLIDTGYDCLGKCGPNGCVCNSKEPPKNNCMRENFGCPSDITQKCTKTKSAKNTMVKVYDGDIYALGESQRNDSTIVYNKKCLPGFNLNKNKECVATPTFECSKNFSLTENKTKCIDKIECKYGTNKEGLCVEKPLKNNTCKTGYLFSNGKCIELNTSFFEVDFIKGEAYKKETPTITCPENSSYDKYSKKCISKPFCPQGTILTNNGCEKNYTYFSYSCPKGFDIVDKGTDCQATCGPNGCFCNSKLPPKNNCKKAYEMENQDITYSLDRPIQKISLYGGFKEKEIERYYGFSSEENIIENIIKVYSPEDEKNKLCFVNKSMERDCVTVKGCSFKGSIIEDKIKELKLIDKFTIASSDKEQIITSTCRMNGNVGWINRVEGITSVYTKDNKMIFWDSFQDKYLGEIEFTNYTSNHDISDGYELSNDLMYKMSDLGFTNIQYINGKTYFISGKDIRPYECDKLSKKTGLEKEYKFKDKKLRDSLKIHSSNKYEYLTDAYEIPKCILVKEGNHTFDSNEKLYKTKKVTGGITTYTCSPISCNNNTCQKASCPEGYDGLIHSPEEFIEDYECQAQSCDATEPYALYCGKSKECDISQPDIIEKDGVCKKVVCESGEYNKELDKCIAKTCPENFQLEDNNCVEIKDKED